MNEALKLITHTFLCVNKSYCTLQSLCLANVCYEKPLSKYKVDDLKSSKDKEMLRILIVCRSCCL